MLLSKSITLALMVWQNTQPVSQVELVDQRLFERSRSLVEERLQLWNHRKQNVQLEEVMAQLMRVAPEHPHLLELAIYGALAEERIGDVQSLWQRLQRQAPNHIATRRVAERMQLSAEQQQTLAQVELYYFAGRYDEAQRLLRALYPEPPITLSTAILYWDVIGNAQSREQAIGGLRQLRSWYPEAAELELAIIGHQVAIDAVEPEVLARLTDLSLNPFYGEQALSLWLRAFPSLTPDAATLREVNHLAGYYPKHSEIARYRKLLLARQNEVVPEQQVTGDAQPQVTPEPEAPVLPDPWAAFDSAVAAIEAGQPGKAELEMQQVIAENNSTDARFAYALILEKLDREDEALVLARQVLAEDKGDGVVALFERLTARAAQAEAEAVAAAEAEAVLAAAEESSEQPQRQNSNAERYLWLGYNLADRDSTPGISSLEAKTWMLRYSSSFGSEQEDRWFVQIEPTKVNAGAADLSDSYWRPRFGTGLLCDDSCPTGLWPEAKDSGVAIGIGVEWQNWHADLGKSPIGFSESKWVGSLGYDGDIGEFGWGAEIERRVLTSALVNFAGAGDPFSAREWGPVVETTLGGSFNWDQGTGWGWWSNLGVSRYAGSNVKSNQRWYAYTGVYKTFYDTEALAFDSGLTALTWGFDNDQSQTTYGQGGYYSPKNYFSLSIPLSIYGRLGRFSYHVRASFGQSESRLHAADFFPAHPELQEEALALTEQTGITPVFEGGEGGGFGRSLSATLEYQVTNHWYIGAAALLERSEFYDPNNFTLYLRYDFGGSRRAPNRPPYPPQRYVSQPWWD